LDGGRGGDRVALRNNSLLVAGLEKSAIAPPPGETGPPSSEREETDVTSCVFVARVPEGSTSTDEIAGDGEGCLEDSISNFAGEVSASGKCASTWSAVCSFLVTLSDASLDADDDEDSKSESSLD